MRIGMSSGISAAISVAAMLVLLPRSSFPTSAQNSKTEWELRGSIVEACSCSPPCTCSFAVGSSPHNYCWFIFSLAITDGHYGQVDLEGMHLAGGVASKGLVWYLDQSATPEQADALKHIATAITGTVYKVDGITAKELPLKGFKRASIRQGEDEKGCHLTIGDAGAFDSAFIMGQDGKTPVVIENNWSWNMQHAKKAKTSTLKYRDEFGNRFDLKGTNASSGIFEWADSSRIYFR